MTALACLCLLGGAASLAQLGKAAMALIRLLMEAQ
jgi:hypothetical protein